MINKFSDVSFMRIVREEFFFLYDLVISYERLVSINNLSNDNLQNIMKYLTDRQLKQSCLRVNKQWNQCASKGFYYFFVF